MSSAPATGRLPPGACNPREALVLFVVLALSAFALVLFMNRLTILLSFVGAALTASYPFMKRWTHLPQFYLGAAFGWGVPMAFAAQTGGVPADAWILFGATLCWAVAYDTAYAMVDRDDDIRVGVKSTAILFGRADRPMIALFHALTLLLLVWAGARAGLGLTYYTGLLLAAGLAGYQQWLMRARVARWIASARFSTTTGSASWYSPGWYWITYHRRRLSHRQTQIKQRLFFLV